MAKLIETNEGYAPVHQIDNWDFPLHSEILPGLWVGGTDDFDTIEQSLVYVEERSKTRIPEERERLRQKLALLLDNDEIEEHRLNQEIIILADKLDVSEESVRLRSHIKYFRDLLKDSEPIGRKLNFLTQELNREINTIGSKANDAEIARVVVGMKEELERIREQAQNIE